MGFKSVPGRRGTQHCPTELLVCWSGTGEFRKCVAQGPFKMKLYNILRKTPHGDEI